MKRILGIDPATLSTGFAVLEGSGSVVSLVESGCLSLHRTTPLSKRIHTIYLYFKKRLERGDITHIAIETPFYGKNLQTFIKLGYVRGIIYLLSEEFSIPMKEFSPAEVKYSITRYGTAPKTQVAAIIYGLFPALKTGLKNDITDAIAIGLTGLWSNWD